MKRLPLSKRAFYTSLLLGLLAGCGGGGDDDPDREDAPIPPQTVAEIAGSAVKGTLVGAAAEVVALNGSTIEITGDATTDENGQIAGLTLTTLPGFSINGLFRIGVAMDADTTMVCDAMSCGDSALGEPVTADGLGNSELTTLVWVQALLGNTSGGEVEGQFQVNMLTTLTTRLIEAAIADGANLSALESFEPAQVAFSTTMLRILGIESSNINVFEETLLSAEAAANFDGAGNNIVLLSLLNAAFAEFPSGTTLADNIASVEPLVDAAAGGDFEAAVALRTQLSAALTGNTVVADLGLVVEEMIDIELPLLAEVDSSGPIQEYTTFDRVQAATLSARGSISNTESEAQVFDDDNETKWLDNTAVPSTEDPAWVEIQFAEAVAVNLLAITSANDADSRDPENFNIQASNDGANWLTLGEFAGAAFNERFETQEFAFVNSLAYTHYRVNITKNKGNDSLMQIAEIELFGPIYPGINHALDGGVVTARGAISNDENETRVFDGNPATKWLDNTAVPTVEDPAWVQIDFPEAKAVGTLAIISANDADERDPENFNIEASNDGVNWVTLAEFAGAAFDQRAERQIFPFSNPVGFSSYRFNVTKNKGNSDLMQIAEIELIGPELPATDKSSSPGVLVTARGAISAGEDESRAFDDLIDTKWLDNTGAPTAEQPSWIQIQLTDPAAVNFLGLTSANDADSRDPENFNVQASNDGDFWVTLGEWTGVAFEERFERQTFSFANDAGFTFYRFNITKNKGNDDFMQIAEIELAGPQFVAVDYSDVPGVTYEVRAVISPNENEEAAFDNDHETKWLDNGGAPTAEDPAWIQVNLPEPAIVSTLALTSANDADSRDPENFNIQGSNDGVTWTTIAAFTGEAFEERFERRSFPFVNGRSYQRYRVNITKNKGNDGLMQIAEIELIGPQL